jgi:hypothetical protein
LTGKGFKDESPDGLIGGDFSRMFVIHLAVVVSVGVSLD